ELRLCLVPLHLQSEGAGVAGGDLGRDSGQQARLSLHEPALSGLLRGVSRERAGVVLRVHQVLEDACCRLWQRPEELHGLLAVGQGVERGGLVASTSAGGGLSVRRARRRLAAPFWRRSWLKTAAEL